jgi:nitroreductase
VVQTAYECLDLARRAPTGFNAQPYKLLLVSSPEQKAKMARYCIGHNAHRVRDSECTAVFLADRQVLNAFGDYKKTLLGATGNNNNTTWKGWKLVKLQVLIGMFSSGFPFPKWISGPLSFGIRFGMRVVSWITRGWLPVPTLSSSETWSQKNTMLVAMTYLLACTSRQLATCPMEGYMAWGIRQSLGIPRRYTIPLIVATGKPYIRSTPTKSTKDDAGMTHGLGKDMATPRFAKEQMIYGDVFGQEVIME